ncbi:19985_t:CDS:1, partial [Racocetra persica]
TNAKLQDLLDDISQIVNTKLNDLDNKLKALYNYLIYPIKAKELLSISKEDIVYKFPDDNQVIVDIINLFKTTN